MVVASLRGWFGLGALLFPVLGLLPTVAQAQCNAPFTVTSTATASALSAALLAECKGETVVVDWEGLVVVEEEIHVPADTSLSIFGIGLNATADGDGSTPLFGVEGATLKIENMALVNGFRDQYGGGAIRAKESSEVHIGGTTVFRGNNCSSSQGNAASGGGAVRAEGSIVTWTGNTTFLSNSALLYDGGALSCSYSSCTGTETTVFEGNHGNQDAGAVRIEWSNFSCAGTTIFTDNDTPGVGGAFLAADGGAANFSGTTNATGNSAATGGAFGLTGQSRVPTNVTFQGNTYIAHNAAQAGDGGGFAVDLGCRVVFADNVTLVGNVAGDDGGGVAIDGDSHLSFGSNTIFSRNSANSKGGAVYANANIQGLTYSGVVFESNTAAIGGAVASYSTEESASNIIKDSFFRDNIASSTGGAIEISVGKDEIRNSTFVNNFAGSGGALRLSGTVLLEDLVFEGNRATTTGFAGGSAGAGPAVSNLGSLSAMVNISFINNTLFCSNGTYMDYVQDPDEASTRYSTVCTRCLPLAEENEEEDGDDKQVCRDCTIKDAEKVPAGCFDTPDGADPGAGATLETLKIKAGWYRATNDSTNIFPCFNEDACLGGQTGDENFCADAYKGHYCSVCSEGYTTQPGYTCTKCSAGRKTGMTVVAVIIAGLVLFVVVFVVVQFVVSDTPCGSLLRNTQDRVAQKISRIPLKRFKILIVTWQIVTQFAWVVNASYPKFYETFLGCLGVVNFGFNWVLSYGCIVDFDFHDRLLISTIGPIIALIFLGCTYFAATKTRAGSLRTIWDKHVSMALFLTFLVYSSVSSVLFEALSTERLDDGIRYLRADYSIVFDSSEHKRYRVYSWVMIVLYPFGIPAVYAILLWRNRAVLQRPKCDRLDPPQVKSISSLWEPYEPSSFFYEVFECFRRIMLTAVIVFIFPDTAAQIVVTMFLAFIFLFISERVSPYQSPADAQMNSIGHIVVFVSMFVALLPKVDTADERAVSREAFAAVLIALHVLLVLLLGTECVCDIIVGDRNGGGGEVVA